MHTNIGVRCALRNATQGTPMLDSEQLCNHSNTEVLELGDPLQMRPVRSVSLFDSKDMLMERFAENQAVPVEEQWGIKAFNEFDYAFELTETKRFAPGDPLGPFLQSLRDADADHGRLVDEGLWNLFQRQCVKTRANGEVMQDPRFNEERYQRAYFVAYYWHSVVRFFYARARREAQLFAVPLLWCQAADDIKGLDAQSSSEKAKIVKALMRHWNIHDTAHLHTLLPLYSGQRVRLTEKISPEHRIVQETEGTLIFVVPDPAERELPRTGEVAMAYCPLGAWVCIDDCNTAPLAGELEGKVDSTAREALNQFLAVDPRALAQVDSKVKPIRERLVFIGAVTRTLSRNIAGKKWLIRRRQLPLTSAMDRTIQSSQGKTFRGCVIGDMGNMNADRDAFWSALYVLLSRATRMEDLLLFRCPSKDFFDKGPPQYLKAFLKRLHQENGTIEAGRQKGNELIKQYKWKA